MAMDVSSALRRISLAEFSRRTVEDSRRMPLSPPVRGQMKQGCSAYCVYAISSYPLRICHCDNREAMVGWVDLRGEDDSHCIALNVLTCSIYNLDLSMPLSASLISTLTLFRVLHILSATHSSHSSFHPHNSNMSAPQVLYRSCYPCGQVLNIRAESCGALCHHQGDVHSQPEIETSEIDSSLLFVHPPASAWIILPENSWISATSDLHPIPISLCASSPDDLSPRCSTTKIIGINTVSASTKWYCCGCM